MLNTVSSHELGTLAELSKGRSESQFLVYLLWVTPVLFSKVFVSVFNVKASVILEYSRTFRLKLYWTLWAGVINTGCNFGVPHLASLGTICPDGVKIVPSASMQQVRTHTAARGPTSTSTHPALCGAKGPRYNKVSTTTQSKYMTGRPKYQNTLLLVIRAN